MRQQTLEDEPEPIVTAGGVVWRLNADELEILIVHRPLYDDWSLPKGKIEEEEPLDLGALREVEEETGLKCRLGGHLGSTTYSLPDGHPKTVDYWAMAPVRGGFQPDGEVDSVRWLGIRDSVETLTYAADKAFLSALPAGWWEDPVRTYLIRHADAGPRIAGASDRERPLTETGRRQAFALADRLEHQGVQALLTSPAVRCHQTLAPLSQRIGADIEDHPALREGTPPGLTVELIDQLAEVRTVLCSHGDVIPSLLQALAARSLAVLDPLMCGKASVWTVDFADGLPASARYAPPPTF